jgi:myosin heavy subunit
LTPQAHNLEEMVTQLSKLLKVSKEDWQMGHTKIFLRAALADVLESLVSLRVRGAARTLQRARRACLARRAAVKLQAAVRRGVARRRYKRKLAAAVRLQSWRRSRVGVRAYKQEVAKVVKVQAAARGKQGRRRAADLRNPYLQMPPAELVAAHQVRCR